MFQTDQTRNQRTRYHLKQVRVKGKANECLELLETGLIESLVVYLSFLSFLSCESFGSALVKTCGQSMRTTKHTAHAHTHTHTHAHKHTQTQNAKPKAQQQKREAIVDRQKLN